MSSPPPVPSKEQAGEQHGLFAFVRESNRIEGIRSVHPREVEAHKRLLALREVRVEDLEQFVADVAGVPLRRDLGQDVRVGNHSPPPGGPDIENELETLLGYVKGGSVTPRRAHLEYERLHPFIDGNGRSGRALWAWQMQRDGYNPFALPFLHRFYYQTLDVAGQS